MNIRRFVLWSAAGVAALLLVLAAAVYWASRSEAVLRWGIDRFSPALPCALTVNGLQSGLVGPLRVQYLACENADYRVEAHNIVLDWSPLRLAGRRLAVTRLGIETLNLTSKADEGKADTRPPVTVPQNLRLPIAISVASLEVATLVAQRGDKPVELRAIDVAYRGDAKSHQLTLRNLDSAWGRASGEASIGTTAPLPLSAKLAITTARPEDAPLAADIALSGQLQKLSATIEATSGTMQISAKLDVAPFDRQPVKSVTASASDIDAAAFDRRLPQTVIAATLQAKPADGSALAGRFSAENAIAGTLDAQRLPVRRLETNFEFDMGSLRLSDLRFDLGPAGTASGIAQLATERTTLALDVVDLNLQSVRGDFRQTELNGPITISHQDGRQLLLLDLRQRDMQIEAKAEMTPDQIVIERVTAQSAAARLRASAMLNLDDERSFSVDGDLARFDPARFGKFPQADINATLRVRGALRPQWRAAVNYELSRSQLRGVALGGRGKFELAPSRLHAAEAALDYGGNDLKLSGSFGNRDDTLRFVLDAKRLDQLGESLAGQVQASGTVAGTMQSPAINADIKAGKLAFAELRINEAQARIVVEQADDPLIRAQATLTQVVRGERSLDSVRSTVEGTLGNHTVEVAATAPRLQLAGRLDGGWDKARRVWSGSIAQLQNQGEYAFKMNRAAKLELARNHLLIGATEFEFSQTEIKLGETRYQDGALFTQGSISGVRAARMFALMDKPPALESTLVLAARWEIRAEDTVNGLIELSRTEGDIIIPGEEALALGIRELRITLRAVANQITAEAVLNSAQIQAQGSAQTKLDKRDDKWGVPGSAPLTLDARLQMQSMRALAALASRSVSADGQLNLVLKAGGTVAEPQLSGNVEGNNLKIEHVANGIFFDQGSLRASFNDNALTLTEFRLRGGQGELSARGRFSAQQGAPSMDLQWSARKLAVVQHPELRLTVSGDGRLGYQDAVVSLNGELSADQGRVELRSRTFPALGDDVVVAGRESRSQLGAARLRASAMLQLDDERSFSVDGDLARFDPARFGKFPQADINATLRVRGALRPQWRAAVNYELSRSQLRGVALGGRGKFELAPSRLHAAEAALDYGGNDLKLSGSFGNRDDTLRFVLDAKRLDQLGESLAGQVQASGTVAGTMQSPAINADIKAGKLAFAELRINEAQARIVVEQADDPLIRAQATLTQVVRGERSLDSVRSTVEGTLGNHTVEVAATAPRLQLAGRLDGGWDKARRVWSGSIAQLQNQGEYAFKMNRAAKLELARNHLLIGATEFEFSQTEIKLGETRYQDGALFTQGSISGVRAARMFALMDKPPALESTLVLAARWEIRAEDTVNGLIELSRTEGDIIIPGEEALALGIRELRITLRAVANQITAEAVLNSAQIEAQGSAQTKLDKRDDKWGVPGSAPLTLDARLQMQSMRALAALASRSVSADGQLNLVLKAGGTVAEPQLSGNVEGNNLKIEHVANGIFFDQGSLRASFNDNALTLTEFRLRGGQGELSARGRFSAQQGAPSMDLQWSARKLAVVQHPELRLTVSGDGRLGYQDAVVSLNGELSADQGRVELRSRTFPALGDDVVVAGRESRSQSAAERKRANLDLKLDLGPDFTVVGRGLNARMAGQIRLTSGADKPLSADGEISVASGTFEAYGRRLQIEKGVLYFAGPVNNPGLNIRAMRKNQPVEAGVEVTGTARDPRVRLVSDPEVSDPNKLAWLVLGRPAATGDTQDNRALQSSAMALAAGLGTSPLQQQLARAVGVDEINFLPATGDSQGGVVAVGKQISDKIYVTQELGMTAASTTLRVSYQLTRRWSVRTESGETDAVDLFFTFSFD